MNPKVEKILKLPLYKRILILSVLVVLMIGSFVWFMWLPEFEKLGQMEQDLSRLDAVTPTDVGALLNRYGLKLFTTVGVGPLKVLPEVTI